MERNPLSPLLLRNLLFYLLQMLSQAKISILKLDSKGENMFHYREISFLFLLLSTFKGVLNDAAKEKGVQTVLQLHSPHLHTYPVLLFYLYLKDRNFTS